MLRVRGSDADEPRGSGEHIWNGPAVPALVLEVEEDDVDRRRSLSRRLEHEQVGRAPVVEEDAMTAELVASSSECGEESVCAGLFEDASRGLEELAQGRGGDVLHEEEVGPVQWSECKPYNTVEDGRGRYVEVCDTPMQGDLGVYNAFKVDF